MGGWTDGGAFAAVVDEESRAHLDRVVRIQTREVEGAVDGADGIALSELDTRNGRTPVVTDASARRPARGADRLWPLGPRCRRWGLVGRI